MTSTANATDRPLTPEFEPPSREAWLALVDKVLKGGDFEQRLVSRTADGLAIQPLYTRSQAAATAGAPISRKRAAAGHRWDIRQRHAEPDAQAANAAILEDLEGGATSIVLQIVAPGQAGLPYEAAPMAAALEGVQLRYLHDRARCAREHDGCRRQPDRDLARGRHRRERAGRRLQPRSAGHAGSDRHPLLSRQALVRDRRQVRARLPDDDKRHGADRRRHALSRGRRQRGAGVGGDAGDLRCLPARVRGSGAGAERSAGQDCTGAGGRCRPVPHHRQAEGRAAPHASDRRGVRRTECGRTPCI